MWAAHMPGKYRNTFMYDLFICSAEHNSLALKLEIKQKT